MEMLKDFARNQRSAYLILKAIQPTMETHNRLTMLEVKTGLNALTQASTSLTITAIKENGPHAHDF